MYKVVKNDTFEIISKKQYGSEDKAYLISQANPNVVEPLTVGTTLNIPIDTNELTNKNAKLNKNLDDVTMLIDNKEFEFFTNISIRLLIDGISTINFQAPMESDNIDFKNTFRPFSFRNIKIYIGSNILFNGTMLDVQPIVQNNSKTVNISAYARCGVLNDCTATSNQYPIEYNNQKLDEISNSLIKPFGIKAIFKDSAGATFERVALEPNRMIFDFLSELAKKRNLIISSDENGDLIFQKSIEQGKLVATLEEGLSPTIAVIATFNPQNYYTHITGLEDYSVGGNGSKYTVKNNQLETTLRPLVFEVSDTETADIKETVNAKMGRMFGNMASYTIEVVGWRDSNNELWKPNTLLQLTAPDAMIYKAYNFIISEVELNKDDKSKTAILKIVIPQSFTGKIPEELPWVE